MKDRSFLAEFMIKKLSSYVEPSRKNIPRGQPIGFSRKKYEMMLYLMYQPFSLDLPVMEKALAARLEISYSQFRNWKYQDVFKRNFAMICWEYSKLVAEHVQERLKAWDKNLAHEINNKPLQNFKNYKLGLDWPEFEDGKTYDSGLQDDIIREITGLYAQSHPQALSFRWALCHFRRALNFSNQGEGSWALMHMQNLIKTEISKSIEGSLLQPNIDEVSQKKVLILLRFMEALVDS